MGAKQPLPEPDGVCPDSDVVVTPRVHDARLAEPIRIVLEVATKATPACTWEVSPDSVFLKVTRETTDSEEVVWSSQQCPGLMPTAQVVARHEQAAEVVVSWSGQKSDPECSKLPGWVHAGAFRATSIARGAVTPRQEDFTIADPAPEIVVLPSPKPTDGASGDATDQPTDGPSDQPTDQPSAGR